MEYNKQTASLSRSNLGPVRWWLSLLDNLTARSLFYHTLRGDRYTVLTPLLNGFPIPYLLFDPGLNTISIHLSRRACHRPAQGPPEMGTRRVGFVVTISVTSHLIWDHQVPIVHPNQDVSLDKLAPFIKRQIRQMRAMSNVNRLLLKVFPRNRLTVVIILTVACHNIDLNFTFFHVIFLRLAPS